MFRKKDTETELPASGEPDLPRRKVDLPTGPLPRRKVDLPTGPAGAEAIGAPRPRQAEPDRYSGKRLIVGDGIRLSGDISSCDRLVVEGEVEAILNDTFALEIASSGRFTGSAEVEEAEISGIYEGDLTVHRRLRVRSTGILTGTVRYGELELERGGQIAGSIRALPFDFIPVEFVGSVYLKEHSEDQAAKLASILEELTQCFGYTIARREVALIASWFQKIWFKSQQLMSEQAVADRAKVAEDILFGQTSIYVGEKVVEMTAKLVSTLCEKNTVAAVDAGIFLFIKISDEKGGFQTLAKKLTREERTVLDENPNIICDPQNILNQIVNIKRLRQGKIEELRKLVNKNVADENDT